MYPKIDVLAFAAHPDDVEISISGAMIKHQKNGLKTGIIDLTRGELGTRGNAETRTKESIAANEFLKLSVRENLELKDGFFEINEDSLLKVIVSIRKYQPEIILINAESDRHPDHGRAHDLLKRACFLSGLSKIETIVEGNQLEPWRAKSVFSYIQDHYLEPDFMIDVSDVWEERMKSLLAYKSQFYDPKSTEKETPISGKSFLNIIEGRAQQMGRLIQVEYAEGLRKVNSLKVNLLTDIML